MSVAKAEELFKAALERRVPTYDQLAAHVTVGDLRDQLRLLLVDAVSRDADGEDEWWIGYADALADALALMTGTVTSCVYAETVSRELAHAPDRAVGWGRVFDLALDGWRRACLQAGRIPGKATIRVLGEPGEQHLFVFGSTDSPERAATHLTVVGYNDAPPPS